MSKADDMFEELGYKITEIVEPEENKYSCGIQFEKEDIINKRYIEFYYYHKQIMLYSEIEVNGKIIKTNTSLIDMQELKAINEKCKELRWIDE